jgi:glutathione synthase/RimK-type ligase-like ATP-grasp enzyme
MTAGAPTSARVAFATDRDNAALCPDDRLLADAFEASGIKVAPEIWDEPSVRWRSYAAVVIRSTWDYFDKFNAYWVWLSRLEREGVRLLNPPSVVRENIDKRYLRRLAAAGVPVVPTIWVEGTSHTKAELATLVRALAWDEVVVKPAVAAGATRTARARRDALATDPTPLAEALRDGAALIQPFLPEIVQDGEWSLLYFDGEFSHAVVKTPKSGDYRVQWRHGGGQRIETPPPDVQRQAREILRHVDKGGGNCLYARVDGVVRDGKFLLMELELTEPYLFLAEGGPEATQRFVQACRALVPGL